MGTIRPRDDRVSDADEMGWDGMECPIPNVSVGGAEAALLGRFYPPVRLKCSSWSRV
jgi:hypothetical protein